MPIDSLPENPDIEKLKDHAKILRDLVRGGFEEPVALVREHHPRLAELTAGAPGAAEFKLADAQLTLARHYGFASWPKLRRHVELVNRLTRSPHQQPVGGDLVGDGDRADELLRLACLNYGADAPTRWEEAAGLLAEHPHLAETSIFTAAAVGHVAAATGILGADPSA
ncbi:MAG: ankyrin repeat domain-containing protein, partial [Actinomycetota bacterium]|nr:ankyrin repeat domain-containing protein [Actinomycetota bacterium]